MPIAVTSQNFRSITGHAGKTRRFLVFEGQEGAGRSQEVDRLDLPKEMSFHEYHGEDHPIYRVDVVVTGGAGQGFIRRLTTHGVRVIVTSETDPERAVNLHIAPAADRWRSPRSRQVCGNTPFAGHFQVGQFVSPPTLYPGPCLSTSAWTGCSLRP